MRILTEPHNTSSFKKGLFLRVIFTAFFVIGLGTASGLITGSSVNDWYQEINKPSFTPPNWLFGPAWLVLYLLISISVARIWHVKVRSKYPIVKKYAKVGVIFFIVHFVFNLIWTPVFFGLNMPILALVIIYVMIIQVVFLMKYFWRIDRLATFLLIPYLLWISFASILNLGIIVLN